ncbi:nucleotidyltransferase domain-containing protein [Candidatus Woesearchaeota archaeon]|jgi:predicted nucleotidyltransferase|nr:nucleotidyltransferase domain-containing protein [Candidatus Woesearchaeota archaeon]MBT6519110.1 nucleotidyltransferase domain-containing protein [Candidatus Woesearchaeota archaeon]MBT7366978.1 nucleotidyltransferase domain-containing protein [Candidatus Woesearchaeota archaeon]
MITLFKPGLRNIMGLFYKSKGIKLHLREIARQTELHEPSVTRFLAYLEKEKVLKSEKDGNLKKFSMNSNKFNYLIFEYFDIERFEKLPKQRKNAIDCFIKNLPKKPVFIILFGSTAKNNYSTNSDIDLLLVTDGKISTKDAEKEVDALHAIKISSFQMNFSNFLKELKLKNDKVVQSALLSGYPIFNQLYFYEVIYNEGI